MSKVTYKNTEAYVTFPTWLKFFYDEIEKYYFLFSKSNENEIENEMKVKILVFRSLCKVVTPIEVFVFILSTNGEEEKNASGECNEFAFFYFSDLQLFQ